jgi:hypothetical protein
MKSLTAPLAHFLRKDASRKNLKTLARLLLVLAAIVVVYSVIFHVIMLGEGRQFSWFTGIYWTLTVMSTLGFGDVTFHSDLGRVFSMWVLLTGTVSTRRGWKRSRKHAHCAGCPWRPAATSC